MPAPRLRPFDRVAHVYDETRGWPPDVAEHIGERLAAMFREITPVPRVFETGIGTGRAAVPLAARGIRIAGIDIAPAMLAQLFGKRRDIDAVLAESALPPFRRAAFDGALFVHILHLVPDADATLGAVLPLVRPGGLVVLGSDHKAGEAVERLAEIHRDVVLAACGVDLGGPHQGPDITGLFERWMGERGVPVERIDITSWIERTSPRTLLARLARRDFSGSWKIPESAVPKIVELATARHEAAFGTLDAPIELSCEFEVRVARLPAA